MFELLSYLAHAFALLHIKSEKKGGEKKHVKNKNVTKYHSMQCKRLFPMGISDCKNNSGTGMKDCYLRMVVPKADGLNYNKEKYFILNMYLIKKFKCNLIMTLNRTKYP